MADIEKIYCCDRGDDNALTAAILSNNNRRGDDYNSWMNNPFAYLMFLAFTRNGFGNNNDPAVQGQLDAIRTQLQDNQNSALIMDAVKGNDFALSQLSQNLNVDFNTLQKCCCDVQAAIREVGGKIGFSAERVINAVNMGDCNVIQALKDCCCATQKLILEQGYQNQLAQKDQMFATQAGFDRTNAGIERGFSATAFQAQQDKCDIIRAGQDNTQRIIDTLNTHWKDEQAREIQDLKAQISQLKQTDAIIARLRGNGCGCDNGCSGF